MSKKFGTTAAIALGFALVAACGGGSDEPTEDAPTPPAETGTEAPADDPDSDAEVDTASAGDEEVAANAQFASFPEPYASADYDRGRRVYLQCQSCHTLDEGGPAVLGPNLYGIFGTEVGTKPGFEYSEALQEASFEWTPDQLDQWLANPRSFLPGNKMSFAGVQRPDDRTAVIAYMMAETDYTPE